MHDPESNCVEDDPVLKQVIQAATALSENWERAFANPIGAETLLVADLGCQSLDIVVLTANLSSEAGRSDIPFEDLLLPGGKAVPDISLRALADFLRAHGYRPPSPAVESTGGSAL